MEKVKIFLQEVEDLLSGEVVVSLQARLSLAGLELLEKFLRERDFVEEGELNGHPVIFTRTRDSGRAIRLDYLEDHALLRADFGRCGSQGFVRELLGTLPQEFLEVQMDLLEEGGRTMKRFYRNEYIPEWVYKFGNSYMS